MLLRDSLRLSLRIFTTRPKRTLLTILGVGIGISAVLFLVSIGYGVQKVIIGTISTADSLLTLDVSSANTSVLTISQTTVDDISTTSHVAEVVRQKNVPGQIGLGDLQTDTVFRIVDKGFFRLSGLNPSQGRSFSEPEAHDLVVSTGTIKLLGLSDDSAIGQSVTVTLNLISMVNEVEQSTTAVLPVSYVIRGIVPDDAISYAYVPFGSITTVPLTTFDNIKVKVGAKEFGNDVRDAIIARGFVVSALSDVIEQANQIFRIVQIVLAALGLIALLVSAIGMFNTMTIALLERTNEIGIMRSIGVSRNDIQKLFLTESMVMGFLGGVGGVALGILAGGLVNFAFAFLAKRLGGVAVSVFVVPWWFVGVILAFSTIVGFLTGIFPAMRASKMDPLEALRYK